MSMQRKRNGQEIKFLNFHFPLSLKPPKYINGTGIVDYRNKNIISLRWNRIFFIKEIYSKLLKLINAMSMLYLMSKNLFIDVSFIYLSKRHRELTNYFTFKNL